VVGVFVFCSRKGGEGRGGEGRGGEGRGGGGRVGIGVFSTGTGGVFASLDLGGSRILGGILQSSFHILVEYHGF
jgi:hypothetical protein